jgi:hypothetical protein
LIDRRTGNRVGSELVKKNCALVRYAPTGGLGETTGLQ